MDLRIKSNRSRMGIDTLKNPMASEMSFASVVEGGGPLLTTAPRDRVACVRSNEDEPAAGGRLGVLDFAAEICVHKKRQFAIR